jgi:hypothetical protein
MTDILLTEIAEEVNEAAALESEYEEQ